MAETITEESIGSCATQMMEMWGEEFGDEKWVDVGVGDGDDDASQVRGRLPAGGDRRDDGAWYGGGQLQVLPEDLQQVFVVILNSFLTHFDLKVLQGFCQRPYSRVL